MSVTRSHPERTLPTIQEISEEQPKLVAELRELDPIRTAATFGGLLTLPELQANCLRIEALVHFAVSHCVGQRAPTRPTVLRSFECIGHGYLGLMEDPSEDVFVTLVNTPRGNFRIFEGISEGAGFYLQRVLNVVEKMPKTGRYEQIHRSVHSMLSLSEAIAERVGVRENQLGQEFPIAALPREVADKLSHYRKVVQFSIGDLSQLGIDLASLNEFVFDPGSRRGMVTETIGHTILERRPIVVRSESANLLLPTAIASAITRYVVELILSMVAENVFERALADEFSELFHHTPILGVSSGAPIVFSKTEAGRIGAIGKKAVDGHNLLVLFFVDGLDGYLDDGRLGANSKPEMLSRAVYEHLEAFAAEAKEQIGFVDGICLLVGCGLGRNLNCVADQDPPEGWRLEAISAYDLATLGWVHKFDHLSLWRLLESVDAIRREGAEILNLNGILNLVACSEDYGGHLVPHREMPDGFITAAGHATVQVPLNALRTLRHKVLTEWNPRRVLDLQERWVRVRKISNSEFEEDRAAPLYGSEDDIRNRKLRSVYVAHNRPWWVAITGPDDALADSEFAHWMMLCTWLARAAPRLDEAYRSLPPGPIEFEVNFEELLETTNAVVKPKGAEELRPLLHVLYEEGRSKIRMNVAKGFHDGFIQPENVAERLLVEAFVEGAAGAAGELGDAAKRESLVNVICPNSQARHMHRFQARSFRDRVTAGSARDPEFMTALDDGLVRIGLGWKVRSRDLGPRISGVEECTSYLDNLVTALLDDLTADLRRLDRLSFVHSVLLNHEVAAHDRDVWSRSSQANIALHEDKQAALSTIVMHQGRLNACSLSSRILLEAAICECPLEGGRGPRRLDRSQAMAKVMAAYNFGGWYDAMRWGAMDAALRITPLGDVHMKPAYVNNVYEPFGRVGGEVAVKEAVDSYARLYASDQARSSFEEVFEAKFLDAWKAEFGVSLDEMRTFVDRIEELGCEPPRLILEMPLSALASVFRSATGRASPEASVYLDWLISKPRAEWRRVGPEFTNKDWYPWRFRRRLSILRRPLIQVDNASDPMIVLAPGLLRDAFALSVSRFHRGEVPDVQARSRDMCSWIGYANNIYRREFNSTVAVRLRELGWQAKAEVKLTEILGRPLDRNYGDIDVLAWRPDSGRVIATECKDVQYLKTMGEVAEQLADFRGEVRSDGEPDHLRRHLDRLAVLAANLPSVAKFLKLALPIRLEGHLVFRNPVPMQFSWDEKTKGVRLSIFDELDRL